MKSRIKHSLLLVFTMALSLVLFTTTTFALIWNGSSSANSNGGTASNGYAIDSGGTDLVGFRFSLVDSHNIQWGNSVDVFTGDSMDTYAELSTAEKLVHKKSKAYWVSYYASFKNDLDTSNGNTNCYIQSDMGFQPHLHH